MERVDRTPDFDVTNTPKGLTSGIETQCQRDSTITRVHGPPSFVLDSDSLKRNLCWKFIQGEYFKIPCFRVLFLNDL